jgi:SAM-dependent methyltransferase
MPLHAVARAGFSQVPREYERGRPSYPPPAVRHLRERLAIGAASRVVELGAGTGKFTRALRGEGLDPIAVEPIAAMRAELHAAHPDVPLLAGVAEALPFRTGSLDAVVAAQAFHWFRPDPTVAALARVLAPGGGVGLVWNLRDESVPWQRELSRRLEEFRPAGVPSSRERAWQESFRRHPGFEPLSSATFPFEQVGDVALLIDRIHSVSFVAALPAGRRAVLLAEIRALGERAVHDAEDGRLHLRYRTEVHSTRRRG